MGRSRFLLVLLLSVLLLTFDHGFARNLEEIVMKEEIPTATLKESSGVARELWEDYPDPEPNFNSRSGYSNIPPSTPHSPAPSPET